LIRNSLQTAGAAVFRIVGASVYFEMAAPATPDDGRDRH